MNIGRGKSVVEEDLKQALEDEVIAGAFLDVFASEPYPADSPFWDMENVYMTPHCCDWSDDLVQQSMEAFTNPLERYLEGEEFEFVVDKEKGY